MAKFFGIGVGPGDPELLTLKAVKCLGELDVLYAPQARLGGESLALSIVRDYLRGKTEVRSRCFPMSTNDLEKVQAWDEISAEIVELVKQGKQVGFITLGDPMIYSTYVYLLERVRGLVRVETVAGIASYSQIAASQNFPLVMEEEPLVVLPCTMSEEELDYALGHYHNIVLMKVYKHLPQIIAKLRQHDLAKHAILVSCVSQTQEVVYQNLEDIRDTDAVSYFSTILIRKTERVIS
ncbi:MAG: precorrin-2 C(20)-methyltransferase [Cellulosilyticaceae bacterium]